MKLLQKGFSPVLFFFLSTAALISCKKEDVLNGRKDKVYVAPAPPDGSGTTTSGTGTTTGTSTSAFSVNWNTNADGAYGYTQAVGNFKTVTYWNSYNTQTSGGMLKATLGKNLLGPTGGAMSKFDVPDAAAYQLQYDIMFASDFDFSWGGKVGFGFLIGDGYTGGVPGWDGNGGSFRLMWYKNTSTSPVILKPYVYYKDQPGTYGNDFGKTYPSNGTSLQKGVWYTVKMYMKSNTGSNTDGRVQMTINGTTIIDQAIRWTTNDLKRMVNNISFENFRGGAESYWTSATDGNILFDNVSWSAL